MSGMLFLETQCMCYCRQRNSNHLMVSRPRIEPTIFRSHVRHPTNKPPVSGKRRRGRCPSVCSVRCYTVDQGALDLARFRASWVDTTDTKAAAAVNDLFFNLINGAVIFSVNVEHSFYARQLCFARLGHGLTFRQSVRPSVRVSVTLVSCIKTVQARITKSSL